MTERLAVWLGGRVVGTLERGPGGSLVYAPGATAILSVAGPATRPWDPDLSRNWFDGLLPEEGRRTRVAARFGLRPEDTFGLLEQIGWECAGAVAVLPEGRDPAAGGYEPIDEDALAERLDALPALVEPDEEIRMSLGGVQDKLLVARFGSAWAAPLDGAPSTHILKPEPQVYPGLAVAEGWALAAAGAAIETAEAEVVTLGGRPVLCVTRYDREVQGETVRRIHQEDGCQALGLPPSAKYALPGGRAPAPTFAALARLLVERASDPPAELARLLTAAVVSVVLRNADLHGKNLSLLHVDGAVRLAPLYDVVPTVAFVPRQTHIGLAIGGRVALLTIGADQLVAEATSWGMPERVARETLATALDALAHGMDDADRRYPAVPEAVREAGRAGLAQLGQARPRRRRSR